MPDSPDAPAIYQHYVDARRTLSDGLNFPPDRDPLAEFSERLVAALVEGTLADSTARKDWDVLAPNDEKIQVKYLVNPADEWVNEHVIQVNAKADSYALVLFEALLPTAVIIFPARNLSAVGTASGKKRGKLDTTRQFTRENYRRILDNPPWFKGIGVRLYLAPEWTLQ